jgi:hypothetical protein
MREGAGHSGSMTAVLFMFYSPECAGGIARKSTAPRQRFTTVGTVGHSKACAKR